MSVGDLYDVERTGEFAVAPTRVRRRHVATQAPAEQPKAGTSGAVAITVLTHDAALADAIHDAAAAAHPVTVATTPDEALELAAHGRCGVLITDQLSAQPILRRMTQRLREAEPALVVIAVGGTNDQSGLISLLSAGVVDRLMLKPVTPALAQIVLKSAAQQHRTLQGVVPAMPVEQREPAVVLVELQRQATNDFKEAKLDHEPSPAEVVVPASMVTPAKGSRGFDLPRPPWIAVVAAVLAMAGMVGWLAAHRQPAIDAQAVIASNLAAGQRAMHEGHALEPRGRSAFDYYNTVLALDPTNGAARQGLDQMADRLAAQAGMAIARGELAVAIVALESLQRVRPDHRQLPDLRAQLTVAQEKYLATVPGRVEAAPQPATKPAPPPTTVAAARPQQKAAEALKRDQLELASAQERRENEELQQYMAKAEKSFDQAAQLLTHTHDVELAGAAPIIEPVAPSSAAPTLKLARMVKPEYPRDARMSGAEGWVNVSLSVTPAGDVLDPRVAESSNGTTFDRAAISAVRKWKYEPFAAADAQRVTVRLEFRMKDSH